MENQMHGAQLQTALYAAETQSANIAVKHILNFIVNRYAGITIIKASSVCQEGSILSKICVAFWCCYTRSSDSIWRTGVGTQPSHRSYKGTTSRLTQSRSMGKKLTLDNERATRFGLEGRGKNVIAATCETQLEEAAGEMEGGMMAKIYWGEEARISEEEILKNVMEVAEEDEAVRGHVPVLLLAKNFTVSTSTIRKALGLEHPEQGSRTLFLLVFNKLSPIKELQGDDLFDAWRQCVLSHYVLWKAGIHHRDVSCENLVYYRVKDKVIGVLNDYDLSSLSSDNPLGNERTGTMLFMAIDLLEATGRDGKVKHLYRHDMESFIWMFIWICYQFKDGKLRPRGPLDAWAKVDAKGCVDTKRSFLVATLVPEDVAHDFQVLSLLVFLYARHNVRYDIKRQLALAKRQPVSQGSTPTASQSAPSSQRIQTLNTKLVEQSDDVVFGEFTTEIGFDTMYIDTIV
ncbi:hypothetical protein PAXINDRAFT_11099 [Paxillus involutus ATCC 200175]|nr:hypothetical protein PAXINDRAFT_11099 [Paxillus involutus ATCC 200175]